MRLFLLLIFCFRVFAVPFDNVKPSPPEEIQSLQGNLLVEGYVSAPSGQISLNETDLRIRGAQDLVLKRSYVPPQIQGRYDRKDKVDRLHLGEALAQLHIKGWLINPHLFAGYNRNSKYFQVRGPTGITLEFAIVGTKGELKTSSFGISNLQNDTPSSSADLRNISLAVEGNTIKITWPDGIVREYVQLYSLLWRLERELLPNGKAIRYEYGSQGLQRIVSCDSSGKYTYASITISNHEYIGSDGKRAKFVYETRTVKGSTKNIKASFTFPVMTQGINPSYNNVVGYSDRTLLNFYDTQEYPISCTYDLRQGSLARINTFSTPSGSVAFSYEPAIAGKKKGSTTVAYPDGAQVTYRFNEQLLLEAIENWHDGKLINQKLYSYDASQHIKSIETKDEQGQVLIAKIFECDRAGNPICETTKGDFGAFSIKRTFDQNRLIVESRDDALEYRYAYLGNTHLPTSKETWANGILLRQTTYAYDDANNLIKKEEVGKTKTTYTLYDSGPHLHRVQAEEQRDWEDHLIHRIEYTYDQWGNVGEEKHFGSNGRFAYTIQRVYNEKDELISETNALGDKAVYQHDARGRCIYEKPISNDLVIRRSFDGKGRLIALREGEQETTFRYNASDELIEKTDYLSATTKYQYDPVHGQPIRIEDFAGVTTFSYDAFGRESERVDPTGSKTQTTYNSYGSISKITHPEGGIELFEYYANGKLKSHRDADGIVTTYLYDPLGRTIEERIGNLTTIYRYDAYNLTQKIDAYGYVTEYEYDKLGRKTVENREGRITHYHYDSLGFLAREERTNRYIDYKNDLLGRMTFKSIDGLLNTSWQYDAAGNNISIQKGDAVTNFQFDEHNRLTNIIDPEGNQTSISYQTGPQVLIETTINSLGIRTVKTYDPCDNLLNKMIAGNSVEERVYDSMHRLKRQDHLRFEYTPNGQKCSMNEADKRTTVWTYTPGDRLYTETKPDGNTLNYIYDAQGKLIQKNSREFVYDSLGRLVGGTHFKRMLDPFGNILREEWTNGLWIESEYDDWDRPVMRCLPDHSKIAYCYEGPLLKQIDRIDSKGKVAYSHYFDQHDSRGNALLETGFFQSELQYDRLGRKVSEQSPYGSESISYDAAGRVIQKNGTGYTYDDLSQMTSESDKFSAVYDSHHNLIQLNDNEIEVDTLNQIEGLIYDPNGNLLRSGFIYDEFGQLIQVGGETYVYDALGRRIQKGTTGFLYIGDEEIGSFENRSIAELKVGEQKLVAIEMNGTPYAPVIDVQGTIRKLIDPCTRKVIQENQCDAFGTGISHIPYAYAGKRHDTETDLIYFGQRFYDPNLRRWLTPDPLGPIDHTNLYQYVYNNPFLHCDPRGESIGGYLLGLGEVLLGGTLIVTGGVLEIVTLGGYTIGCGFQVGAGMALITDGLVRTTYEARDLSSYSKNRYDLDYTYKSGSVDPSLPANPDDLLKRPDWKETTHPDAGKKGHRTFENEKTGEKVRHDAAKPGESGHKAHDHYHRDNPKAMGNHDKYLDGAGNPVRDSSDPSHIYHPDNVWWKQ